MKNLIAFKNVWIIICLLIYTASKAQISSKTKSTLQLITNEKMPKHLLNFVFKDSVDRDVRISDFEGKYVIVDLWYSGCGACIHCNQALRTVHEELKDSNIVFLSISIDKTREQWILGITADAKASAINNWAGKYWPAPGTVVLYTGGSGSKTPFTEKYVPNNSYPQLLFIDPKGMVISNAPPRPDSDPKLLINYIKGFL